MLKKVRTCLLGAAALVSITGWAADNTISSQEFNYEMRVDLPANRERIFYNPTIWKLSAECTISSEDESNDVEVLGVGRDGSVNEIPVTKGSNFHLIVHPNEVLYVTATSGAQVQLTNHGPHTVNAVCILVKKEK